MRLFEKSREFKKYELYALTNGIDNISIKNVTNGTPINVTGYIRFIKEDNEGKEIELLALIDGDFDEVYVTQSDTFKKEFSSIIDTMVDDGKELSVDNPLPIIKTGGTSRSGREYHSCRLNIEVYREMEEITAE